MSSFDEMAKMLQEEFLRQAGEIYSETVIEHWLNPRNQHVMNNPDGHAKITGPCADTMEFFLRIRDDEITGASFRTDGCLTTIASGSMAVEMAVGKAIPEVKSISRESILLKLDGLPAESRHCALLAANTLNAAVDDFLSTKREPWKRLYRQ